MALAIVMVILGNRGVTPGQGIAEPAAPPYEHYVSGAGIIEAKNGNIAVGTLESGIVKELYVGEGDHVKVGDPLFRLDGRDLQARLRLEQAELKVMQNRVTEAERELEDKRNNYVLAMKVADTRAISVEEVDSRRNAMRIAEAKVRTAKALVEQVEAMVGVTETNIDRLLVRAPVEGEILQLNLDLGEYAFAGETRNPLVMIGDTSGMQVRVDIDENDAWRFDPEGKAFAVLRGNPKVQFPLTFDSVDPYVLPKRSLTGDTTERVDTRVLQVYYTFDPKGLPVYVGQQVDVYMESNAN